MLRRRLWAFLVVTTGFHSGFVGVAHLYRLVAWLHPPTPQPGVVYAPLPLSFWVVQAPLVWLGFGAFTWTMTLPRFLRDLTSVRAAALGLFGGSIAIVMQFLLARGQHAFELWRGLLGTVVLPGILAAMGSHGVFAMCAFVFERRWERERDQA